ncbi:hypothetical protein [Mucilaginibacter sp.]|uniref:hypothetical protein n=1 Tax=Mucilaginibacter sp. TaxID=1882438 RepID=UPI00283AD5DA|nr:hypothetical protein [Mucilaginibacter sp.]MDR3695656.1 hypothetical protein [Mucilaginibacter sp.]
MEKQLNQITDPKREKRDAWFDGILNHLITDKMMLDTGVAPTQTQELYQTYIHGNPYEITKSIRDTTTQFFIQNLVQFYFKELTSYSIKPQRLAFDFSDAKILVWAQIADEDESSENALILSEAKANSKFSDNGFFVTTTIVEESDKLSVPSHYHEVNIHGKFSGSH